MILIHNLTDARNLAIINDTVYLQIEPVKLILLTIVIYGIIILAQRLLQNDIVNTIVNLTITIKDNTVISVSKV
mgnify:CR=1 FL=1